jgi:hypothetical protein
MDGHGGEEPVGIEIRFGTRERHQSLRPGVNAGRKALFTGLGDATPTIDYSRTMTRGLFEPSPQTARPNLDSSPKLGDP